MGCEEGILSPREQCLDLGKEATSNSVGATGMVADADPKSHKANPGSLGPGGFFSRRAVTRGPAFGKARLPDLAPYLGYWPRSLKPGCSSGRYPGGQ